MAILYNVKVFNGLDIASSHPVHLLRPSIGSSVLRSFPSPFLGPNSFLFSDGKWNPINSINVISTPKRIFEVYAFDELSVSDDI